jgi:hypothetical protein
MAVVLEKFGVRVPYPENWVVEEGRDAHWPDTVTVQSPGSAFWSLSVHEPSTETNELAAVVLNAIREEYKEVEAEAVHEVLTETDLYGFDLSFYCMDLVIQSRLRVFSAAGRKFMVLCQGEDREFDRMAAVFEAMTRSVLDRRLADRVQDSTLPHREGR